MRDEGRMGWAEERVRGKGRYLSYLLRLWQEGGGDLPLWRASLERPQSDERMGFASLQELFAFLQKETGSGPAGLERPDGGGATGEEGKER